MTAVAVTVTDAAGNKATQTVDVAVSTAQAGVDLVATVVTVGTPVVGVAQPLSVTVKNVGATDVAAGSIIGVGFLVDDVQVTWVSTTAGLAAGATITLSTATAPGTGGPWTPAAAGAHQLTAFVDDLNRIPELVETNNKLTVPMTIGGTTPPPPPPPPPSGNRDLTVWPFASSSPWNLPRGSGATFAEGFTPGQYTPWVNFNQAYSATVYYAVASDPTVTFPTVWAGGSNPGPCTFKCPANATPPAGGDGHVVVIQPDRLSAYEFWVFDLVGKSCGVWILTDLRGAGVGQGWCRAAGCGPSGGLIRAEEVAAMKIPHALAIGCGGQYAAQAGYLWPAISSDHTGEGTMFAIPSTTAKPALSPIGSAVWDALRDFGAFDMDTTGGGAVTLYAETHCDANKLGPLYGDIAACIGALRRVTNAGPNAVGGPGTRLAPLAP